MLAETYSGLAVCTWLSLHWSRDESARNGSPKQKHSITWQCLIQIQQSRAHQSLIKSYCWDLLKLANTKEFWIWKVLKLIPASVLRGEDSRSHPGIIIARFITCFECLDRWIWEENVLFTLWSVPKCTKCTATKNTYLYYSCAVPVALKPEAGSGQGLVEIQEGKKLHA